LAADADHSDVPTSVVDCGPPWRLWEPSRQPRDGRVEASMHGRVQSHAFIVRDCARNSGEC
jgi:hypothetical protein